MNDQDKFKQIRSKSKSLIDRGIIQRFSRISYDVIWNIILFFIVIGIIGLFFIGGVGAGYFASLIKDEPLRSSESMVNAIYNYEETSEIYFANEVYLGEVSSDLHREVTALDQVSDDIIHGIIATEDEYFETHEGIVPKAILRAVFQEVTGSNVQTGGSTLTQQIIKNQILTNEVSFDRKAKEIILAMRLEKFMDKDEILEAYLNIVSFGRNANGRNIAGIQTATEGIFGLDADEVNLAQAAFLAGLPQSPISYSPFTNSGSIKSEEGLEPGLKRMETVLSRMLQAGYITEEQYEEALEFDLVASLAERQPTTHDKYPYLSEEIRRRTEIIIKEKLALEDGYTLEELQSNEELNEQYQMYAARELSQGGYKIHTTINKELYDTFQDVTANYNNFGRDKTAINRLTKETIMTEDPETGKLVPLVQQQQAGAVLRDNKTGAILAFVAGRDFEKDNVNFATATTRRQVGSTAKPLIVYGPAFEEGTLQPGSVIADVSFTYSDGSGSWSPTNFVAGRYYGLVTARTALAQSYNVSTASAYIDLLSGHNPVPDYLVKMGFDHFSEENYSYASNALGTFDATVEENTDAFSTFANKGKFVEGYMIETIETVDGETIYQHESEPVEVFSSQTSYLIIDMMRDVLTSGTGRTARASLSHPNVDWAGKTGTTNDFKDAWFVALNPNVTLGTWMGYGYEQPLDDGYSGRNQAYWAQLVNAATEVAPDIMAPSKKFEQPDGIVKRSFSLASGLIPSDITKSLGLVGSDIFNSKFVPKKEDYSLIKGNYIMIDGKAVAPGKNTPSEFTQGNGVMFNPEWLSDMGYDKLNDINQLIPANNSIWNNVKFPNSEVGKVKDDGKKPNAPRSLSKSGNTLSWSKSSSNDVVGYRVYRAKSPDGKFSLYKSTTDTSINVGKSSGVYQVAAVDYFGRESKRSSSFVDGSSDKDNHKNHKDKDDKKDNKNKDDEKDEKSKSDKKDKEDKKNNDNDGDRDNKDKSNDDKSNDSATNKDDNDQSNSDQSKDDDDE
ncbi:transglycosylase domain-containing protein [Amphibacillus sp. MSJ-3]|uniref:transglycosylase domain-containing protein n=1 Tax=Amphibacillus sp. MSJ-3 TaxID=2841505 RepID=UPI001C0F1DE2|nr:transglycosylase domain-containing protein [Amphibacillus sp. MSJ-3]MBU5593686.1 transglycosylase domain-containing protein [Amphibacillus sp. MSJ-3]